MLASCPVNSGKTNVSVLQLHDAQLLLGWSIYPLIFLSSTNMVVLSHFLYVEENFIFMLFCANALCSVVAVQCGCRSCDYEEVSGDICGY